MLETSRDILNWVLAISSLAVAFFLCWGLYYLISTFRRGFKLIRRVETIVFKTEGLIDLIKTKISSSASYLFMVSELVKRVSKIIKNKKEVRDDGDEEDYDYEVKPKKKRR